MIEFKNLPSVDKVLRESQINSLIEKYGHNLVKLCVQNILLDIRKSINNFAAGEPVSEDILQIENEKTACLEFLISKVFENVNKVAEPSLKPVINGSGIVLHTNLGRAPYGEQLIKDATKILKNYTNLEFDLKTGMRGERNSHARELIKYLTGAEDVAVVNNNAAAVILILSAFGHAKETIVSRGELVEVGGSFRIPDVMEASGSIMKEVGSTNKTHLTDYQKAITDNTAILFKAHKSNYSIKGFTEEVSLKDMAKLSKENGLISVYDIGSGLLRKIDKLELKDEPIVKDALADGIDLVCFSGDKLLGASQAGIIAGKKELIAVLKKHPLMRALRVCKMTLALLETACSYYLDDEKLFKNNILFRTFSRSDEELLRSAQCLQSLVEERFTSEGLRLRSNNTEMLHLCNNEFQIPSVYVDRSFGQYGGGTLPDLTLESYSVKISLSASQRNRDLGKAIYHELLLGDFPVLANLIKGEIFIDVLCVEESEFEKLSEKLVSSYLKCVLK